MIDYINDNATFSGTKTPRHNVVWWVGERERERGREREREKGRVKEKGGKREEG